MQNGRKPPQNQPSPAQNRSGSKFFLDIPIAHEQGQICICDFVRKIISGKKFPFLKTRTGRAPGNQEKPENTVSMFIRAVELNALLLKNVNLRLDC